MVLAEEEHELQQGSTPKSQDTDSTVSSSYDTPCQSPRSTGGANDLHVESSSGASDLEEELTCCPICCETGVALGDTYMLESCGHRYCKRCWHRQILIDVQEGRVPPRCLCLECSSRLSTTVCLSMLLTTDQEKKRLIEAEAEASIPQAHRHYCPIPQCAKPIRQDQPKLLYRPPTTCPHCSCQVCLRCQRPWHPGQSCRRATEGSMEERVLQLAHDKRWRQCPGCRQMVEKRSGCNSIRCKCSHEFCYVCGKSSPSCECWARMTRSQRALSVIGGVLFCCFCCPCVFGMVVWECCNHN